MTHKTRIPAKRPSLHHSRKKVERPDAEIIEALPAACASEAAAVEFIEKMRWGDAPACPRCGSANVRMMVGPDGGRNPRFLWRCYGCKAAKRQEQFTVRIGSIFEDSRLPLRVWTTAMWRMSAGKKGCSALELSRIAHVTHKTALFVLHRIRWAMATDWSPEPKMSGNIVADETVVGPKFQTKARGKDGRMRTRRADRNRDKGFVIALVNKETGETRTKTVRTVTGWNLAVALRANVDLATSRLITDELKGYRAVGAAFELGHSTTNHSIKEYVRHEDWGASTTNPCESFFSLFKRGLTGIYHSVRVKHLHRYASEFEFRANLRGVADGDRLHALVRKTVGKRLTYAEQVG